MTAHSVFLPLQPADTGSAILFARVAREHSAARLWCGQSLAIETQDVFAYLSGLGYGLPFGSGVELMPLRHPYLAAAAARSTALVSGHDFIAGVGPAATMFRDSIGVDYRSPLQATRDYLAAMRGLLDGGGYDFGGPGGPAVLAPVDAPPVRIGVGVLGSRMAAVAGEFADVAVTWLTPLDYLKDTIMPIMADNAPAERRPSVSAVVHCAVARPGRDLTQTVQAVVGAHLSLPHYVGMLNAAGVPVDASDPAAGSQALLDHNVVLTGTASEIAAGLRAYRDAGIDELAVNVGGVYLTEGPAAALTDLEAILDEG
ncbi:Flavin-dependent oxidoreductase, luciferase family (includes alkanesulfonate monooxygenase SsuD and methylene tetrahydromethanopterin reductase) [Gordonia malaquae]|uniref:Putative oxidoreductase n=1 Tax=Gordonia malaquae NBRC 108250 TaxID=1223542 RepID=M3VGK5_GORML|nr:LLM class flavin-dependent oxidoreductase [Gordonia malaquae]GAC80994.1 putative oxidoreductase [Gordonia malaquae NBRC 108250]SEE38972.1 Flavin-dependent oxidoreductase, luciferase family (includes alkanesulfonate monooxygenase SsuD and methylene tetrahydromethanopterin reductase) [Gordonia malaquae]